MQVNLQEMHSQQKGIVKGLIFAEQQRHHYSWNTVIGGGQ